MTLETRFHFGAISCQKRVKGEDIIKAEITSDASIAEHR